MNNGNFGCPLNLPRDAIRAKNPVKYEYKKSVTPDFAIINK